MQINTKYNIEDTVFYLCTKDKKIKSTTIETYSYLQNKLPNDIIWRLNIRQAAGQTYQTDYYESELGHTKEELLRTL